MNHLSSTLWLIFVVWYYFYVFNLHHKYVFNILKPMVGRSVGAGEPIFNMSYGRLHASIDKVEAILTHES